MADRNPTEQALTDAIFALNDLTAPEASRTSDVDEVAGRADESIEILARLRENVRAMDAMQQ